MGIADLFFRTSSRSFVVKDAAGEARKVVDRMTVADGAPGGLPPGVVATRTGEGHFNAASPFAVFDARISVEPLQDGFTRVTETKRVFSPIPGFSLVADLIHDVATSPRDAYFNARKRG